jgi:hypothetical protein
MPRGKKAIERCLRQVSLTLLYGVSFQKPTFQEIKLESKIMKLSYLGVNYKEAPSTLEVTEGEINSMYRGRNRPVGYVRHIPEPLPMTQRQHCGVAYRMAQSAAKEHTAVAKPATEGKARALSSHNKREVLEQMMNSHLRNIHRSLEHRLQVARAKGDQKLVRLLEAESEQMTLSCPVNF